MQSPTHFFKMFCRIHHPLSSSYKSPLWLGSLRLMLKSNFFFLEAIKFNTWPPVNQSMELTYSPHRSFFFYWFPISHSRESGLLKFTTGFQNITELLDEKVTHNNFSNPWQKKNKKLFTPALLQRYIWIRYFYKLWSADTFTEQDKHVSQL